VDTRELKWVLGHCRPKMFKRGRGHDVVQIESQERVTVCGHAHKDDPSLTTSRWIAGLGAHLESDRLDVRGTISLKDLMQGPQGDLVNDARVAGLEVLLGQWRRSDLVFRLDVPVPLLGGEAVRRADEYGQRKLARLRVELVLM